MVQPFQLEKSDIKGRLGLLSTSVGDILRNKDYPNIVSKLLAEACLLTSLIGQSMELKWKLSLQIRGKGPVKLIATDYFNFGNKNDCFKVRDHASFNKGYNFNDTYEMEKLFGDGYFAIIIDQGAVKALNNGKSLLPAGVKKINGMRKDRPIILPKSL